MKLSILICSLVSRLEMLNALRSELDRQAMEGNYMGKVEVLTLSDNGEMSIGEKRNELMKRAKGEYVCYIDDDDVISKDYLKLIFSKIMPDCCSLTGIITWDDLNPELFEHSIKYKAYKTNNHNTPKYERHPNHLNVIRKEIASRYSFIPVNHGEDTDWSVQIFKAGEIKTEAEIKEVLYHYKFKTKK